MTTTAEIQKPKNISSKAVFTPKGNLIIENNSSFIFDINLWCSGGSYNLLNPYNGSNSTINSYINTNIDLWQNQLIDGLTTTTYTNFQTNTSSSTDWDLSIDNDPSTPITFQDANVTYLMNSGQNINYVAWNGFKTKLNGTIIDPDDSSYSETLNASTSCRLSEDSINFGNFGWEISELYFNVNFDNYTKLKLVFTAEVLSNGNTVLNIKQILY